MEQLLEKYEEAIAKEVDEIVDTIRNTPEVKATGKCLFCYEPIKPDAENKRFCDSSCRDDWDTEQHAKRFVGVGL